MSIGIFTSDIYCQPSLRSLGEWQGQLSLIMKYFCRKRKRFFSLTRLKMDWKSICELNSSKIHVLNSKAEDHLKCFCTYPQLIFLDISWVVLLCKTLANFVQSIILRKERFVNNLKWEKESLNFWLTTEASQSERYFSITNMARMSHGCDLCF